VVNFVVVVDESIRCDFSGTFGGLGDTPLFAHNFSSTYVDVILSLFFLFSYLDDRAADLFFPVGVIS
jgi:hypothetical protein